VNYYNDVDPCASAWLRELVADGLIPDGKVDDRSILDVQPSDLEGFAQCHFFAGIGGWPLALKMAGWPEGERVWTGSCPCQPFSVAGKHKGEEDERHLWPEFRRLIEACKPPVIFGEQVASKDGREWLANVREDMESLGYDVGAADLCAASVGAPHMRQRLFFGGLHVDTSGVGIVLGGDAVRTGSGVQVRVEEVEGRQGTLDPGAEGHSYEGRSSGVADAQDGDGRPGKLSEEEAARKDEEWWRGFAGGGADSGLADGHDEGLEGQRGTGDGGEEPGRVVQEEDRHASQGGCPDWNGRCRWHPCRDGKSRRLPVKPSLQPLANGISGRMGLLRGAGNAIVPAVAARFVKAFVSALGEEDATREAFNRPEA